MGRYPQGTISAGQTIRVPLAFSTILNPQGDWGQAYMLAHPNSPPANIRLVCDFHAKSFSLATDGNFYYFYWVDVRNTGTSAINFDVDF